MSSADPPALLCRTASVPFGETSVSLTSPIHLCDTSTLTVIAVEVPLTGTGIALASAWLRVLSLIVRAGAVVE